MPPKHLWPQIEKLREQNIQQLEAVYPHINLLYGFWPEEYFGKAIEMLSTTLPQFGSFDITLTDIDFFTHKNTCTAWLKPESQQLRVLQSTLEKIFPDCDEVSKRCNFFNFFILLLFYYYFIIISLKLN